MTTPHDPNVADNLSRTVSAAEKDAGLSAVRKAAMALRQPLSLIIGPTQHLLEATSEDDPHHEQLAMIARNCEELLGRVDELYAAVRAASRARVGFKQTGHLLARNLSDLVETPSHLSVRRTDGEAGRLRVLVVDDSPDTRLFVAAVLGPFVKVEVVASGEEALARLKPASPPFDAVVSDVMMPGMGGDELARAVRGDQALTDTGLMLLTGRSDAEFRAAVIHETVDDYLVKPFDTNELTARVVRLARDARARAGLRRRALTDALTGLPNRAAMVERLEHPMRHVTPGLNAAIFDIDHFEGVNDTWAHGGGDEVLQRFGRVLRSEQRDGQLAGRWGGEEFVLILPRMTKEEAHAQVASILERRSGEPCRTASGPLTITASAGIARRHDDTERWPALLARADARLYEAKDAGRNRAIS